MCAPPSSALLYSAPQLPPRRMPATSGETARVRSTCLAPMPPKRGPAGGPIPLVPSTTLLGCEGRRPRLWQGRQQLRRSELRNLSPRKGAPVGWLILPLTCRFYYRWYTYGRYYVVRYILYNIPHNIYMLCGVLLCRWWKRHMQRALQYGPVQQYCSKKVIPVVLYNNDVGGSWLSSAVVLISTVLFAAQSGGAFARWFVRRGGKPFISFSKFTPFTAVTVQKLYSNFHL